MFSAKFEQEVIKAVRDIVKDILQDEITQDKRYNQKELCCSLRNWSWYLIKSK